MLHDQGLLLHLWAKACNTIVYFQNQSPLQIISMITPGEDFSGRMPNVSHFKIFGASVYCYVSIDLRKKLEVITEFGFFVGYTETPHNYYVHLPSLRMIVMQRDVKFDEEKVTWCYLERELLIPLEEDILAPS